MHPRFFSQTSITESTVELTESEHQHLSKVLRLGAGDKVTLFDNSGYEFVASVLEVGRNSTKLEVESSSLPIRELPYRLTVGVSLPKGDRQQWVVEKCVELGVTELVPLVTQRGVAQAQDKTAKRMHRWIIAASKQCRRNILMNVAAPESLLQFAIRVTPRACVVLHPDPNAEPLSRCVVGSAKAKDVAIAVGPEGGFTEREIEQAKDIGCRTAFMGDRILRIETAAVAAASAIVIGRLT